MNLRRLGERGVIDWIRRRFRGAAPPPPAGIGDDAALIDSRPGPLLATTDCLIESRHFRRREPACLLGRKALCVNLSDIAAMGGRPDSFLLTLGIPADLPAKFLDDLVEGMARAAREHGVDLIGGDTSSSPGPLVISITVIGRGPAARGARAGRVLTRGGARPGDAICVSGALGGSAAGRLLLEAGWRARLGASRALVGALRPAGGPRVPAVRALDALRMHLDPAPRLALGRALLERRIASACIDLSDGLSIDLARLAEASGVGARLLAPAIPIADCARCVGGALHVSPLHLALHGGEDYELLFTVPPGKERRLMGTGALVIGRVTSASRGLKLVEPSGRQQRLRVGGFDHFRPSEG